MFPNSIRTTCSQMANPSSAQLSAESLTQEPSIPSFLPRGWLETRKEEETRSLRHAARKGVCAPQEQFRVFPFFLDSSHTILCSQHSLLARALADVWRGFGPCSPLRCCITSRLSEQSCSVPPHPTSHSVQRVVSWILLQVCHRPVVYLTPHPSSCHHYTSSCQARSGLTLIPLDSSFLPSLPAGDWHTPVLSVLSHSLLPHMPSLTSIPSTVALFSLLLSRLISLGRKLLLDAQE